VNEEVLQGGIGNAGLVVRVGDEVRRPASPHAASIHALLRHVRSAGFDGVPEPLGFDRDGRERLRFIPGDAPCPPFPAWAQTDTALASMAALLRRFHDAAAGFVPPPAADWSSELADPLGGPVLCHNDVCPENVVFRDGDAVALLDFEYAAPGRPIYDLGVLARMCIPLDTAEDAARMGYGNVDPVRRLRVVADAYGLPPGRQALVDVISATLATGGQFVRRRVERGDPAFVKMWHDTGGAGRYERRRTWFERSRSVMLDAVG
jgi:Phosphotransferase enzyme family